MKINKQLILSFLILTLLSYGLFAKSKKTPTEKPLQKKKHLLENFNYDPSNYQPLNLKPYMFIDETGKADMIGGIYYDKSLDRFLVLSKSFLEMSTSLFVSSKLHVHSIEDLKGITIGVTKGNFAESYLYRKYQY